jgi:voltage-gated potassium channel Kch
MFYGESPARVIITSAALILVFAFLYPFFGGVHIDPGTATHVFFDPGSYVAIDSSILETFVASLYFSAVTFSTLGYGGIQPATTMTQFLASLESFVGGILIALLVAVFARRALR